MASFVEFKPFYTHMCIINNLPYEYITTLLHSPSNGSFLSILQALSKTTCGLCEFVHAMHFCPYSRDTRLCLCHEPFCPLLQRLSFMLVPYTFVSTPGTLVCARAMNLWPFLQIPLSMLTLCTFVPTLRTLVRACVTPPYRTLPSVLIPLVRKIDTLGSFLVSP